MSMAMKYAMKKRMAKGGDAAMCAHGSSNCEMCHAKGGEVGVHDKDPSGEPGRSVAGKYVERANHARASNKGRIAQDTAKHWEGSAKEIHEKKLNELKSMKKPDLYAEGGFIDDEESSGYPPDLVSRILHERMMSKGGQVSNDTPVTADFEDNQFDDLVKDDDLEFHDTGANSGDEIGDAQEDEDRHDIVGKIMKSRSKKGKMPRPA